jgi:hypothetical protein
MSYSFGQFLIHVLKVKALFFNQRKLTMQTWKLVFLLFCTYKPCIVFFHLQILAAESWTIQCIFKVGRFLAQSRWWVRIYVQVSISSTFYARNICTKVCSKPNCEQKKAAQKTFVQKIRK